MTVIKGDGRIRRYAGRLIKDPDISTFGEKKYPKARLALSFAKGDGNIVNVEVLFDLADACRDLRKNDRIIVDGMLDSYDGKDGQKRWFLDADSIYPDVRTIARMLKSGATERSSAPAQSLGSGNTGTVGFTEIENADLPF